MSLYGPTFHVTPVDLCIIYSDVTYIYPVSCLVEIKLFQIVSTGGVFEYDLAYCRSVAVRIMYAL